MENNWQDGIFNPNHIYIVLNVNSLNTPTTIHQLSEWVRIRQQSYACLQDFNLNITMETDWK